MEDFEKYQTRINKSLNSMEAKISFLHDGVKGLSEAFKDFQHGITDFMSFTAEHYSDHEQRITALENQIK